MTRHPARALAALFALTAAGQAAAQPPTGSRGQMLYENHCHACHTAEVHWRDKKLVTDWDSLLLQVRIWQTNGKLNWSEAEVQEVAQHLNALYYRLPPAARY